MFDNMISFLDNTPKLKISKREYEIFHREFIFDQLKGIRFGRAFCEKFNVNDVVVRKLIDDDLAKELIEETYIKK